MGREIRRVRPDWRHPTDETGRPILLLENTFEEDEREWETSRSAWDKNENPAREEMERDLGRPASFEDYAGPPPLLCQYMPLWKEEEASCFQVYTLEGAPLSPVFKSVEAVRDWLEASGDDPSIAENLTTQGFDYNFSAINQFGAHDHAERVSDREYEAPPWAAGTHRLFH